MSEVMITPADAVDAETIAALLDPYVATGIVLKRTPEDIRENIGNFLTAWRDLRLVGAVAVRDFGGGLNEIRSLVVHPDETGKGIGSALIKAAVALARRRGAGRVFALTLRPGVFQRQAFAQVDMDIFPEKVWSDCRNCPKRDCCDEVAMLLDLRASNTGNPRDPNPAG